MVLRRRSFFHLRVNCQHLRPAPVPPCHSQGSLWVRHRACTAARAAPQRNFFSAESQEDKTERAAVESLEPEERKRRLEDVNAQLRTLQRQRDVLSGDAFSMRGSAKIIARDYGFPFVIYWWACWSVTGVGIFGAISMGGLDPFSLVAAFDGVAGTSLVEFLPTDLDPLFGNAALAVALNELLEPVRLPLVLLSTPAMMRLM
jgi:hypothetical protein